MFKIERCDGCYIYVHDQTAQCTIDFCDDSIVVMGPCASSTFVRNCKSTKLVLICQQLRLRDCHNLEIMIFTQTDPIIEASTNITFHCHQNYYYAELASQMIASKLSMWNNKWTEVFDFTQATDGETVHFTINN